MKILQLTPELLLKNKNNPELYLSNIIEATITPNSWMTEWKDIALRFQLFKFLDLSTEEILSYSWDKEKTQEVVRETVQIVKEYIELDEQLQISIVPALPFPWFKNLEQSVWINGFTNSKKSIWIAIPPNPDISFLRYLLAHELHHASPENPIYQLTVDHFPLKDWYKMEGTAEYFSLQLFEDKRWWKDSFTLEVEERYISEAKSLLHSTDDKVKGPLCFGDLKKHIPYLAGYSFAYNAVKDYLIRNPIEHLNQLFEIDAEELLLSYNLKPLQNRMS
ncbi:DUF2268 domain-containing putative Zn-dependent protease [Solibacillus sp. FSL W8-0474]|uniref:DUF2268 domain-containing putative Zn-dependent protease n=1 Tax=Solibacillus sp. FSL W8-0474 TaxID=2975336 RepID=UPI0030F602EA